MPTTVNSKLRRVMEILSLPLPLVVVTALLSSYLLPILIKDAQDRTQAHQLRTQIAKDIATSAAEIVTAVQMVEHTGINQELFDAQYLKWQAQSAAIDVQIRGAFADERLAADWRTLACALDEIYALSGTYAEPHRISRVKGLEAIFKLPSSDWDEIRSYRNQRRDPALHGKFHASWMALRSSALEEVSNFAGRVSSAAVKLEGPK